MAKGGAMNALRKKSRAGLVGSIDLSRLTDPEREILRAVGRLRADGRKATIFELAKAMNWQASKVRKYRAWLAGAGLLSGRSDDEPDPSPAEQSRIAGAIAAMAECRHGPAGVPAREDEERAFRRRFRRQWWASLRRGWTASPAPR
jgi:hypothetical protein